MNRVWASVKRMPLRRRQARHATMYGGLAHTLGDSATDGGAASNGKHTISRNIISAQSARITYFLPFLAKSATGITINRSNRK